MEQAQEEMRERLGAYSPRLRVLRAMKMLTMNVHVLLALFSAFARDTRRFPPHFLGLDTLNEKEAIRYLA
jgi:hypothetical protein